MDASQRRTPAVVRRSNVQYILGLTRTHGPVSRRDLGQLADLSKPTVQAAVEELLRTDLVLETSAAVGTGKGRSGPAPRLVRFNANHALVAGVDVGGAKMLALLSNLDGDIIATSRCATPAQASGHRLDKAVKTLIDNCLSQAGVGRGRLAVATVGTAGVVDRDTSALTLAPNLPGWQNRTIRPSLEAGLQVPVLVESEAHLAMLGESWVGVATNATNAVFIQLGVGVGMGILIDGEIYRGAWGAAGEIGYLPFGPVLVPIQGQGPDPADLGAGRFESAVGSTAFTRQAIKQHPAAHPVAGERPDLHPKPTYLSTAEIFALAGENEWARSVVQEALGHLSNGLVSVASILNPELVVLGGGLAPSFAPYLPDLQHHLSLQVPKAPDLKLSALADNAVAVGAIRRGITFVEDGLLGQDNHAKLS
jgi:predicted NBD/HSP70 family sugar kinase